MNRVFVFLACLFVITVTNTCNALELSSDNYDTHVAGKTVFLKFFAPWCGHCKKMKPDWDKLMDEYKDHPSILVADVDCTADGKDICAQNGVQGYPSIKHGDPANLEDYKGGRTLSDFQTFAKELKPACSLSNIGACDDAAKTKLKELVATAEDALSSMIKTSEDEMTAAEEVFKTEVEKLQKTYEELSKKKEDAVAKVKAAGVGMIKAVLAHKKSGGKIPANL